MLTEGSCGNQEKKSQEERLFRPFCLWDHSGTWNATISNREEAPQRTVTRAAGVGIRNLAVQGRAGGPREKPGVEGGGLASCRDGTSLSKQDSRGQAGTPVDLATVRDAVF